MMRRAAVLLALSASCSATPAYPPEELFYRFQRPLDSMILHFRADGTFQFYTAAHFTTQEGLGGTWRRTGVDSAELRCERWSRLIVSGPLWVRLGKDWPTHRERIRTALEKLLADHAGQASFAKDLIEDTAIWEEERLTGAGPTRVSILPLSATEDVVPRAAVEGAIRLLGDYGRDDPRVVHVRFHAHRAVQFMEWTDWSGYCDPIPLAAIREQIDRLEPGQAPADAWVRVTRGQVEQELTEKDGLRFFKR